MEKTCQKTNLIIAIDGPVGAGKSTVAKLVAQELGYLYMDTGAMYRAIAWKALKTYGKKILNSPQSINEQSLIELTKNTQITLTSDGRILADNQDITQEIRSPEISNLTSPISAIPGVRKQLVELQRQIGKQGNIVAEGRDMQTVVFPNAQVKIYLTASLPVRAQRKYKQLLEKDFKTTLTQVKKDIEERDKRDSTRKIAPLTPAPDAILVDTDNLTIQEVIDKILKIVKRTTQPR